MSQVSTGPSAERITATRTRLQVEFGKLKIRRMTEEQLSVERTLLGRLARFGGLTPREQERLEAIKRENGRRSHLG